MLTLARRTAAHAAQELFNETIGPIKSAALAYNSHGKSTGTATIEFRDPKNATKAYQQYNGRMIDGSMSCC